MPGVLPPPVFLTPRSGPTAARIAPARSWSARARAPRSLRSCSSGAAPAACGSSLRRPRRFDTRPIARRYSRRHHPLQSRSHAGRGGRETEIAPRSQHRSLDARRLDRRTPRPRDLCAAPRGGVAARAARPNHSHGEALPPAGLRIRVSPTEARSAGGKRRTRPICRRPRVIPRSGAQDLSV